MRIVWHPEGRFKEEAGQPAGRRSGRLPLPQALPCHTPAEESSCSSPSSPCSPEWPPRAARRPDDAAAAPAHESQAPHRQRHEVPGLPPGSRGRGHGRRFPPWPIAWTATRRRKEKNPPSPKCAPLRRAAKNSRGCGCNRLAGHVYFSHAAHVTMASMKCEECHRDMNAVDQAPTEPDVHGEMSDCVACHRSKHASLDCLACHK